MKTTALIIVIAVTVLCSILLIIYEKKNTDVKILVLIAVMTAMSVAGRIVFAALPGFKPVTAIIVITGIYLGQEAGFFCGALTALITNCYFGQGPWTPFQMLIWGMIGIGAGLIGRRLRNDRLLLIVYGVGAGIIFSLLMDVYTVIWTFGGWKWSMYLTAVGAAVPYTIIYAVSNVVFLLALTGPMGKKLERIEKRNKA